MAKQQQKKTSEITENTNKKNDPSNYSRLMGHRNLIFPLLNVEIQLELRTHLTAVALAVSQFCYGLLQCGKTVLSEQVSFVICLIWQRNNSNDWKKNK